MKRLLQALQATQDYGPVPLVDLEELTGRRVAALMGGEIGGGNGLLPITWAFPSWTPTARDAPSRR